MTFPIVCHNLAGGRLVVDTEDEWYMRNTRPDNLLEETSFTGEQLLVEYSKLKKDLHKVKRRADTPFTYSSGRVSVLDVRQYLTCS